MDATESLKDHESGVLDKLLQAPNYEEIINDDCLALVQLQSSAFEVKVDVQALQKLSYWILVSVRLLLDDLNEILERVATATVDYHGSRQVAKDVRTHRLDRIQVQRLVQEHLDDEVTTLGVIEENQHTPVNEPCALLKHLNVAEAAVVDKLAQPIQILQSSLPVESKNLSGQLAPQNVQVVLVIGLHNHQTYVQVRGGLGVGSALVEVLGQLVDGLYDVNFDLKRKFC